MDNTPLDVWLAFDSVDEDEATAEANTFVNGNGFAIQWYLNTVGLVKTVYVDSIAEAHAWYAANGFDDYSTGDN